MRKSIGLILAAGLLLALSACGGSGGAAGDQGHLNVITTTNIVADVVRQVGGGEIQVDSIIQPGQDPHNFSPTPQDIARVADADLIFTNGAGLEAGFIDRLVENAGANAPLVAVSDGIQLLHSEESVGAAHAGEDFDPHTWTDPNNVLIWVDHIETALQTADPAHQDDYAKNAEAFRLQLRDLDAWIKQQVEAVPPERRNLVSDHNFFTYFAERYGFHLVGALIPGFSTAAQPSAQELAQLQDAIRQAGVQAILVGRSANPTLAERVAADTGARVVTIYTGSLSEPGGEADSYLKYMRFNVSAIMEALQP